MSVTLEIGPSVGGVRTGALVRTEREAWAGQGGIGGAGVRRPVALLVDGPGGLRAFSPAGDRLGLAALRRRYPAPLSAFEGHAPK